MDEQELSEGAVRSRTRPWWSHGRDFLRDRGFFAQLIPLAVPVILQSLVSAGLMVLSNFLVGQWGETSIAAVGLAGLVQFFVILTAFGINSGAAVFGAQFWGAGDLAGLRRTQGLSLVLSLGTGLLTTFFSIGTGGLWLPWLSPQPEVAALALDYLLIVAWTFPLHMVATSFTMILRTTGEVLMPFRVSLASLGAFVAVSVFLVFGPWQLGALGTAWGLLASKIAETALLIWRIYAKRRPNVGRFDEFLDWPREFVQKYLRIAAPVFLNEVLWSLLTLAYRAVYAMMGKNQLAAYSICDAFFQIAFILFFGTGAAAGVLVGNAVGRDDRPEAVRLAKRFSLLAPLLGSLMGLMMLAVSLLVPVLYRIEPQTRDWAIQLIVLQGLFLPFMAYYHDILVGVLRGGGDTRFGALVDIAGISVTVPLVWWAALSFHADPSSIFTIVRVGEVVICAIFFWRIRSGAWIRKVS